MVLETAGSPAVTLADGALLALLHLGGLALHLSRVFGARRRPAQNRTSQAEVVGDFGHLWFSPVCVSAVASHSGHWHGAVHSRFAVIDRNVEGVHPIFWKCATHALYSSDPILTANQLSFMLPQFQAVFHHGWASLHPPFGAHVGLDSVCFFVGIF